MSYNALTGSVCASAVQLDADEVTAATLSGSLLYGNGAAVTEIPRIVANATADNLLTVGGNANSMVGEPNLTFNGTILNVNGDITASAGISAGSITASVFVGDGSGLTNVSVTNVSASGPTDSLQYHSTNGQITGSSNLMFSSSVLAVNGGLQLKRVSVNDDYNISTTDYYVGVDTVNASGIIALGLPNASLMRDGQTVVVKDEGGNANARNITINAAFGQTIDGQNSIVLESPYASIHLYCNGANKYFIY
jgi:hypothetical protein